MHGSDRVPDLNIDYERALVGRAKATASTRAKWRSLSACYRVLEECLTPPTLLERRCYANYYSLSFQRKEHSRKPLGITSDCQRQDTHLPLPISVLVGGFLLP
jgi:hypothetical protein